MAVRIRAWIMTLALVCGAAAVPAQVGPPVEPAAGADSARVEPTIRERPAESEMPLMAPARGRPESPEPKAGPGWGRSLASVALVVGLILVLAAVARAVSRRSGSLAAMLGPGGRAPSGVLEVLARYPVGRGQTLVLLRLDRRVLLLSQSAGKAGGFTTLAQFDDAGDVASILRQTRDEASESVSARFRQAMERFQGADASSVGVERGEIVEVGPRGEILPKGRGVWA